MRKYVVVEFRKNGDQFQELFDTLEEANYDAEYKWAHLIREEKKNTHVYVGHVEDTKEYLPIWAFDDDEEGEIDFLAYHSLDTMENYFDSKKEE